ncbi:MAG TPA: type 1 glutamine amidotransferase family protein [bacterium]|nr:type 1 glutamine amidotransferase family protein [bacterium]
MPAASVVCLYLLPGMADWEAGLALAELHTGRFFRKGVAPYAVRTLAVTREPVVTLGGMRIIPDVVIGELAPEQLALLLLPGSDQWQDPLHAPVLALARRCLQLGVPVAAICGATVALAAAGLLDDRCHTSNDLGYLKTVCPAYRGEAQYRHEPAVLDGDLITASGTAPVAFARCILQRLQVCTPTALAAWQQLFATHEAKHYLTLMRECSWRPEGRT